jgi:hypothetical protein
MSCDGVHDDPKCWTKETDHCSKCGRKMSEGEWAYQHKGMLAKHGRAPVWCSRCEPSSLKEWELFQVGVAQNR